MNETLPALLLRLSEAATIAVLGGWQARRHLGPEFDRLLGQRVLVEQSPVEVWSPCPTCECAAGERLIQTVSGRLVAACPLDSACDVELQPDDVRVFEVDRAGVVDEIARASGFTQPAIQLLPDIWRLTTRPTGEAVVLILDVRAVAQPSFIPALRHRLAGKNAILLLPAQVDADIRQQLNDGGFQTLLTAELLRPDWSLELSGPVGQQSRTVRLVFQRAARRVELDGVPVSMSDQPFRLLLGLSEAAVRSGRQAVQARDIEEWLWGKHVPPARDLRDVVREVREAIDKATGQPKLGRQLVRNARSPVSGWYLALAPGEVMLSG